MLPKMLPRMLHKQILNRPLPATPKTHLRKVSTPSKPNQVSKPKMSKIGKELTLSAERIKAREPEEKKREEAGIAKNSSALEAKMKQKQQAEGPKAAPVAGVGMEETKHDTFDRAGDNSDSDSDSHQQHSPKESLATTFMYGPWAAVILLAGWALWEKGEDHKARQTDRNDRGDEDGYGGGGPGGLPMTLMPTRKLSSARQGRLKEWTDGEGKRWEQEVMKEYGPNVTGKRLALLAEGRLAEGWLAVVMMAMPGGFPTEGAVKGGSGGKKRDEEERPYFGHLKGSVEPKSVVQQQARGENGQQQSEEVKDGDSKDSWAGATTAAQAGEGEAPGYVVVEKDSEDAIEEGYDLTIKDKNDYGKALRDGKGYR